MGLNFRKSIKIADGVKVNLSKSGASVTVGKKGVHNTINTKGKMTTTVSAPGTGVYYTKSTNLAGKKGAASSTKKTTTKKSNSKKSEGVLDTILGMFK